MLDIGCNSSDMPSLLPTSLTPHKLLLSLLSGLLLCMHSLIMICMLRHALCLQTLAGRERDPKHTHILTCSTRKQTLRSLSVSYQKKDGRGHARPSFFWYDNDRDLKVCFLVTRVISCPPLNTPSAYKPK